MSQSQQTQSNEPHHEGMIERMFEHHGQHHQHGDEKKQELPTEPKPNTAHKESEKEKYSNWYHKEEEEEEEGDTYGGLM
ncbi:hypothetical protein N7454_000449 [Penicillium verhagenii]|nr:hypothetical protein N7454_000449 [Penicillium verhagenii]